MTTTFAEHDGRTTVTCNIRYGSKIVRDVVSVSPVTAGLAECYDNLERLLAA